MAVCRRARRCCRDSRESNSLESIRLAKTLGLLWVT